MKRFLITTSAAAMLLCGASASAGTISGSAHDFSGDAWAGGPGGEICAACHAPHNNGVEGDRTGELLWNHEESTATYTVYSSPTFGQTMGQPAGNSKLCMSCHDGTVALDSYGGATGTTNITTIRAGLSFGNDLSNDHPISFPYVATGEELAATTTSVTFADNSTGTIGDDMLDGSGLMQCSSCHDVHNTKTNGGGVGNYLLVKENTGSALCLTCHTK